MENIIIIAVLLVIVLLAAIYIIRAKKSGVKCVGCPSKKNGCSGDCGACFEESNSNKK